MKSWFQGLDYDKGFRPDEADLMSMEKVNKLKLFHNLANAQGISTVVNTKTSTSAPSPLAITIYDSTSSPTPTIETPTSAPEVDQLVDIAATLYVEELIMSLVSTKRAQNEDQQFPQDESSPKLTRFTEGGASREVTSFMRIPNVFSYRLTCTLEEAAVIVSMSDLSFIQNIPQGEKMEIIFELAHNIFKNDSIFSLISTGQGDVLAPGNPTKERDTWKGKCEAMYLRCSTLQKKLVAL
ncbi:unnamed protein product [Vicia faba]|uniref:Uncharacterized protein n=1 Tax=Vicia faba TaxID=3906 RepID=A0AAV0Z323_VICFA|nr:unnamed protein product [Vicia faba]